MKKNLELKVVFVAAICLLSLMLASASHCYAQIIRQAAGLSAADIQGAVGDFRADLGINNGVNGPTAFGRREINWDGVPDELAAPNNLPANFFNFISKRGVVLATPGAGFQVSASSSNATATPVEFGNLNPAFPDLFRPFSPERLFTALGSNIINVSFFVPGTSTPAVVSGFGAVFTDVERGDSTKLEFFDLQGNLIFSGFALAVPDAHESLSFLSASFATPQIALVRITSGDAALDAQADNNGVIDLVVMDDFIYGEPQALTQSSGCGSMVCFAEPSFWAAQLRRPFSTVRGVVNIPGVNKTIPISVSNASVLLALSPPPFLAAQPRSQLLASYVAAQISMQNALTGSLAGGSSTLGCYGVNVPVTLSNGAVINSFTTVNQLLAETDVVFRTNPSEDIAKLIPIYQRLQATCNL